MNWRWNMYNSNDKCADTDLTFLSYNQCINYIFTADEILSSDLWKVLQVQGDVYKCIPLFNCESITSSNSKDTILDTNKCLIMVYDTDTRVSCTSEDTGGVHYYNIVLYAFTPYTQLNLLDNISVHCIVYDEHMNTLNNVPVNVLVDNILTNQVSTDSNGECEFKIDRAASVQFMYGGEVSNIINITED